MARLRRQLHRETRASRGTAFEAKRPAKLDDALPNAEQTQSSSRRRGRRVGDVETRSIIFNRD